MPTVNVKDYAAMQRKRISQLQKGKRRGPITAAKYLAAQARSMAPRKTGNLLRSIRRNKNVVRVSGVNPKNGFPYIHWINRTPSLPQYHSLRVLKYTDRRGRGHVHMGHDFSTSHWVPVPGNTMVYGASPSGWNWTGVAGFVTRAQNRTRIEFKNIMERVTKKAIRLEG